MRVGGLRRAWDEFVGPEATPTNTALTLTASAVALVGAGRWARRHGAGQGSAAMLTLLAVDLVGGAYVNNTRACVRWYERPGQGTRQHLQFAALHAHPAAIAYADNTIGRQPHPGRWAAAHYTYMLLATVLIRGVPEHRRVLGVTLTVGGLALDRMLGPSRTAPWFAWTYYPKLVMGHAAAALWSDAELPPPARPDTGG